MKVLTIKNIYNYHHAKTERSKLTILSKLNKDVIADSNDPRNYWHRSLTAISKAFKKEDHQIIIDRIEGIKEDYTFCTNRLTKLMYERNIRILNNFLDFNFGVWKPQKKIQFISHNNVKSTITINGLQVKIYGVDLYTYIKNDCDYIGGIWFVAQINGYKNEDLALFTDALYRLLHYNFSEKYIIDSDFCCAIDVFTVNSISYTKIKNREIAPNLDKIINEIKQYL